MNTSSAKLIKGATGDWEMVIGLEVHAHVTSNSKLFSGASTEFGGEPNSHVSLVDAAMPGMLPVINEVCVRQAVRTGLGLKAQINLRSVFDRKNYFYPDLPQGYQISQYLSPIVGEGEVVVELEGGETATIGIERLHLEQDAGKSLHDQNPTMSFVDLNRAGVALMEIVSKPDIRSSEQAKAYVSKLRSILRYLGTCDGDMEKGSLRADVNVSVRKPGGPLGTRCEIKNMNSINFIGQAIEYEALRQIGVLEDGGSIDQETRLFDPNKGETRSMRSKEEAHDYRYFPDPDLLPLEFTQEYVDELKAHLPELPDQKKTRFLKELGMNEYTANVLVADKAAADFFEKTLAEFGPFPMGKPRTAGEVSKWVLGELFGRLNKAGLDVDHSPVSPKQLAELLSLQFQGTLSGTGAKQVLDEIWKSGSSPSEAVQKLGLKQENDIGTFEKAIDEIVIQNPEKVEDAKTNPNTIGWFVGQVMKSSGGKANPQKANELLRTKIFEDWTRTKQEPLQRGERLFDFYDQSGRAGYEQLRSLLNLWLSEIEDRDHQEELVSRLRYGGNNAFRGALCELLAHDFLVRLGHKIVVHPNVDGTNKRPDFALIDKKNKVVCYVEVTTVNRADELESELNREAAIYKAIDAISLPPGCLLGYELVQAGPDSPALHPLVSSIEQWTRENSNSAPAEKVIRRFTAGNWVIELELFSGGEASIATGAIGLSTMRGGLITPHSDIRAALYRKSRWYGTMGAPYMIVVADAKDQMFGKKQVRNAITEAVFGDELTVSIDGEVKHDFALNGLWRGPNGPRNQHITAVLLLPQIDIWKLRDPKWEPILALNPWSTSMIPSSIKSLSRFEAEDGKWVEREGKPFADILGLPVPWPSAE